MIPAVQATWPTTSPREHCHAQVRADGLASCAGQWQAESCRKRVCVSAVSLKQHWRQRQTRGQVACSAGLLLNPSASSVFRFCTTASVPQLDKACRSSPNGCNSELQTGWLGRLLQLARLRRAVYGKSLTHLSSRLITFWIHSPVCSRHLESVISAGRKCIWNLLSCQLYLSMSPFVKLSFLVCILMVRA